MIKQLSPNTVYICDFCIKEILSNAIMVYYPHSHCNESEEGPSHFCSDDCLVKFQKKIMAKYGKWVSRAINKKDAVPPSNEDSRSFTSSSEPPKKARRASRKNLTNKRSTRKKINPEGQGC